jgi:hypothetical protein
METIKVILSGIGFILFGISCYLLSMVTDWKLFDTVGIISSFMGLIMILTGMFTKDNDD